MLAHIKIKIKFANGMTIDKISRVTGRGKGHHLYIEIIFYRHLNTYYTLRMYMFTAVPGGIGRDINFSALGGRYSVSLLLL